MKEVLVAPVVYADFAVIELCGMQTASGSGGVVKCLG